MRPRSAPCAWAGRLKGRAGKGVTTVTGLPLSPADIEALATQLKKRCGSGGTVRDGVIEIQGDHRDAIVAELDQAGLAGEEIGRLSRRLMRGARAEFAPAYDVYHALHRDKSCLERVLSRTAEGATARKRSGT